jgi:purine nucleosidase
VQSGAADDAIAAAAREHKGELTLIALGPLTNVATAILNRPELAGEFAEILVMGGALQVPGNVSRYAEFNIFNDPPAAAAVFASGAAVSLVGLDVTTAVSVSRSSGPWSGNGSQAALQAGRILDSWFATHPDFDRYDLHDPLTVVAAIDPTICTWRRGNIAVDIGEGPERGRTTIADGDGPGRAASGVDADRALSQVLDLVQGGG